MSPASWPGGFGAGRQYRYGAWRGGPDPLAPPYDAGAAVDQIGSQVLAGESLRDALRDLLRRGTSGGRGLDELRARARRRRQELMRSGRLDGGLTRARALLDQALAAERDELRRRAEGDPDTPGAGSPVDRAQEEQRDGDSGTPGVGSPADRAQDEQREGDPGSPGADSADPTGSGTSARPDDSGSAGPGDNATIGDHGRGDRSKGDGPAQSAHPAGSGAPDDLGRPRFADPDDDFAWSRLDSLPGSTAAAMRELEDYAWRSPEAAALYQQLLDELRSQVLQQQFGGLQSALSQGGPSPEQAEAMRRLVEDLTDLLDKHARGEATQQDFEDFMAAHGEELGIDAENLDELLDELARRAAAAQRLMNSLSPEQRAELSDLIGQAMQQAGLEQAMAKLSESLRTLRPQIGRPSRGQLGGQEPLDYGQSTGVLGELADLDAVIDQFAQDPTEVGHTLDNVDADAVERTLGRAAADELRRLAELERALRQQGWVTSTSDGITLSPKALRRLGATALRRVFADLESSARGGHDVREAGAAGELTGASRPWQLGDTQPIDVVRTVSNAIRRHAGEQLVAGGASGQVRLSVDDFEVAETERRAGACVALCVDLSYSMVAEGRWGPMKETALALAHLVATRYPQDALQIIGFGRYAMTLSTAELAGIEPSYEQGTNLAHALALAERHLRRHPEGDPVVLVVTDGEPTAHLDLDGEAFFTWPPMPETIRATIDHVDRLARMGAVLNTFMLGDDDGLRRFVDAVARRGGGRVFTPDVNQLGAYLIDDYAQARRNSRR
ncbi:MAG: hypothetical protein ACK5MT_12815 [Actinomycetales bacterium]